MPKRDCYFGLVAGTLIGLLFVSVLRTAVPQFYGPVVFLFSVAFFALATPLGLLIASYLAKKIPVIWQFAKFVVTGSLNALLDIGALSFFIFAFRGLLDLEPDKIIFSAGFFILSWYSIYKGASFIIANINSYFWNKFWTFEKNSTEKAGVEFIQFFTVSVIGFLVNVGTASYIFKFISPAFGTTSDQWAIIGAAAGSIASLVWNFLGYKFIVFKK